MPDEFTSNLAFTLIIYSCGCWISRHGESSKCRYRHWTFIKQEFWLQWNSTNTHLKLSLKYRCSVGLLHSIGTLLFSQDKVQALRVISKAACNLCPALLSIHIPFLCCGPAKLFVAPQKHQRLNYKLTFPTERLNNNNFYNSNSFSEALPS